MDLPSFEPSELIRILCGIWLIPHIVGKLLHIERASIMFDKVGFRPARAFVLFTVFLEVMASIGLVFGIYEKLAASLLLIVLLGAAYAVLRMNGFNWRWQKQGPEYIAFWAIVCVVTIFLG